MVHFLEQGAQIGNDALMADLDHLPEEGQAQVIELLEVDGNHVVVTHWLPDFLGLVQWVRGFHGGRPPITPDSSMVPI